MSAMLKTNQALLDDEPKKKPKHRLPNQLKFKKCYIKDEKTGKKLIGCEQRKPLMQFFYDRHGNHVCEACYMMSTANNTMSLCRKYADRESW